MMIMLMIGAAVAAAQPAPAPAPAGQAQHMTMPEMAPAAKEDCCCKDMMAKMHDGHKS